MGRLLSLGTLRSIGSGSFHKSANVPTIQHLPRPSDQGAKNSASFVGIFLLACSIFYQGTAVALKGRNGPEGLEPAQELRCFQYFSRVRLLFRLFPLTGAFFKCRTSSNAKILRVSTQNARSNGTVNRKMPSSTTRSNTSYCGTDLGTSQRFCGQLETRYAPRKLRSHAPLVQPEATEARLTENRVSKHIESKERLNVVRAHPHILHMLSFIESLAESRNHGH